MMCKCDKRNILIYETKVIAYTPKCSINNSNILHLKKIFEFNTNNKYEVKCSKCGRLIGLFTYVELIKYFKEEK